MPVGISLAGDDFDRWDDLHRLLMDCFAYMAPRINPPTSLLQMGPDVLAEKAKSETLILAMDDERIAGCIFVRLMADKAYVGKLAVDPDYRGQSIARRLMDAAESMAAKHGAPVLELETRIELHENHAAFAKLGFIKVAENAHAGFDRPTSITMQRPVSMTERETAA